MLTTNKWKSFSGVLMKDIEKNLKDFTAEDPKTWKHGVSKWMDDGRFEELGQGNMGLDVKAILDELKKAEYDGWISVEQDRATHHSPAETAIVNMEYLKSLL